MVYFFVGEDEFSKDIKLEKIKQELNLTQQLELFNFEILYSKDLDLRTLQERLLLLPVNPTRRDSSKDSGLGSGVSNGVRARQRLILIKDISGLSTDIKQYLLDFLKKPFPHVSLILDARRIDERDQFFNQISSLVKLINFRQSKQINAFTLARQIMHPVRDFYSNGLKASLKTGPGFLNTRQKRVKSAMRLLRQLLLQGEKPEKILGAFRYQLHQERLDFPEKKKRLMFLLNCDIDIKTGRLKPEFALERLLIRLCY